MLANLEPAGSRPIPSSAAWMCELHLAIPGITFQEQLELADQLAATGDAMRAAVEFDRLAARVDSEGPEAAAGDDTAARLRARARALRARLN